jgi:hypothetical protein
MAEPMSYRQPTCLVINYEARSRRPCRHLSPPVIVAAAAVFAAGVAAGYIAYLHRSPVLHKHIAGTSAWPQQLVLAVLTCAVFGYAFWRHHRMPGRRGEPPWLLSPLGGRAVRRLTLTMRSGFSGPSASGRAISALPLAGLFLYGFYRAGEQVTAGLDPNFTVNAWGGPTYFGAMACHYLDLLVLMGAAVWMLHLILLPDPANAATDSAAPTCPSPGSAEPPQAAGFPVSDRRKQTEQNR